jgi:hypothetical protein
MTDLVEFLEARITEDEAAAKACSAAAWSIRDEPDEHLWVDGLSIHAADSNWDACIAVADAEHAVRHDPARILAECAAKRAIIKQADEATSDRYAWIGEYCVGDKERAEAYATDPGKLILEALAAVYSDHPDYQQEWAHQ